MLSPKFPYIQLNISDTFMVLLQLFSRNKEGADSWFTFLELFSSTEALTSKLFLPSKPNR